MFVSKNFVSTNFSHLRRGPLIGRESSGYRRHCTSLWCNCWSRFVSPAFSGWNSCWFLRSPVGLSWYSWFSCNEFLRCWHEILSRLFFFLKLKTMSSVKKQILKNKITTFKNKNKFFIYFFRVSVEEQIHNDVPLGFLWDGAPKTKDFTSKQPPHKTDAVFALGIARDSNINKSERRVGVAESNDRDVDVAGLSDGLVVGSRVGHDQKTRLTESSLDLIGEGSGCEPSSNRSRSGVVSELQYSSLAVVSATDDEHLRCMFDRHNCSGC